MKLKNNILFAAACIFSIGVYGQEKYDTRAVPENWGVYNRKVNFDGDIISLDAAANDGILWLKSSEFANGVLEFEVKGANTPGKSFVGIAFHGLDNDTFDAVYFRPFNFKSTSRSGNSVQYISMPDNDWSSLRKAFPGKYENTMNPVSEPDDWFHVRIEIDHPNVKVYVNGSKSPTLKIDQISTAKKGKIGFWVGNGSKGEFKNLTISPQ